MFSPPQSSSRLPRMPHPLALLLPSQSVPPALGKPVQPGCASQLVGRLTHHPPVSHYVTLLPGTLPVTSRTPLALMLNYLESLVSKPQT